VIPVGESTSLTERPPGSEPVSDSPSGPSPNGLTGRGRPDGQTERLGQVSRVWWTVAGLTVLLWAFELFGYVDIYPLISLAVVVLGLWGLGTILAVWQPWTVRRSVSRLLAGSTLGLSIGAFVLWSFLQIIAAPAYGTDEIAFDQYAAQLLHHGLNPYTQSMGPAFSLFHVSPDGYTFLLNGHAVTSLSYPALSFLFYVPFVALGWNTQMAVVVNVFAWALSIALTYVLLPRSIRPLAIVIGSFSVYISYAVGGVTDALFVPLLIGAVYRWDRFATTRGPWAWRGPILLGLAMAVKQTPWLVLPFLVAGVALEARRIGSVSESCKTAGRYLAIALGAFLLPNLPFIVDAPHAWVSGVLTPIASHTVPAGQGLIGLSLFLGIGGGSLMAFAIALVVIFAALWVVYVATYPSLKPWAVLCPAVVLFFSARSFGSYLVTLIPATIVAACTTTGIWSAAPSGSSSPALDSGEGDIGAYERMGRYNGLLHRRWRWTTAACVLASGIAVFGALLSRPPLAIRLLSVRTTGQLATVVELGVEVTNETSHEETPNFSVESGGQLTAFWLRSAGPSRLPPWGTSRYTLLAPNFFSQPPITGGFQVVAFTASPGSVSRSAPYVPTTWHVSLVPDAVNRIVPVGQPVTIKAEVLDKLNRSVNLAGEPVYLGQIIYSQQGLIYGQAIINQAQQGQTPVAAYTNGQGIATFVIRGTEASLNPVYFEANLVNDTQFYPYGYSEILPIRFGVP
jgi:hypothetical protein